MHIRDSSPTTEPHAQDGGPAGARSPAGARRLGPSGTGERERPQRVVISCRPGQAADALVEAVRRAGLEPVRARCWREVIAALVSPDTSVLVATGDQGPPDLACQAGDPGPAPARQQLHWDALRIDVAARVVTWQGTPVPVTEAQFELLLALLRARGAAVPVKTLARAVYGQNSRGDTERVRAHVVRLRERLRGAGDAARSVIVTVRGYGYRLASSGTGSPAGRSGTAT